MRMLDFHLVRTVVIIRAVLEDANLHILVVVPKATSTQPERHPLGTYRLNLLVLIMATHLADLLTCSRPPLDRHDNVRGPGN